MNMPKSCEVADLATWVHKMWAFDDRIMPEDTEMARAVRALLEEKCDGAARQAYRAGYSSSAAGVDVTTHVDADVHFILARVFGAP